MSFKTLEMKRVPILLAIAALSGACQEPTQPPSLRLDQSDAAVVRVAAPTGNPAVDIPNIRAAIAAATPGVMIQFAHGTYDIGNSRETQFVVSAPGVTLQGDRRGTTLSGVELHADDPDAFTCCPLLSGTFLLNGGHQTVRRLTFDGYLWAISLGAPGSVTGGYHIEHNTFRAGFVGIDFAGLSDEPTIIEENTFENVTAPLFILGKTLRIRRNRFAITNPGRMTFGQPSQAVILFPEFLSGTTGCENNVIEGNTVVRFNEAFVFFLFDASWVCHNNVIRDNRVIDARIYNAIPFFSDNGTMALFVGPGRTENNLIQNNVLRGSEGLGVVLDAGSGNQIIGNEFHDLPGLKSTFSGYPGTAIILGAATSGNRVRGNEFENVVNTVVDLGTDNSVKGARQNAARLSAQRVAAPEPSEPSKLLLFRRMRN